MSSVGCLTTAVVGTHCGGGFRPGRSYGESAVDTGGGRKHSGEYVLSSFSTLTNVDFSA